jgi:hypothetical protein
MPLTNAQKQRRYRERHLGPDGDLERVTFTSALLRVTGLTVSPTTIVTA